MRSRRRAGAVIGLEHCVSDAGDAVTVSVVEHVPSTSVVEDERIGLHLGVPAAAGLGLKVKELVLPLPAQAVSRLGIPDPIGVAARAVPHAVEIAIFEHAGSSNRG